MSLHQDRRDQIANPRDHLEQSLKPSSSIGGIVECHANHSIITLRMEVNIEVQILTRPDQFLLTFVELLGSM